MVKCVGASWEGQALVAEGLGEEPGVGAADDGRDVCADRLATRARGSARRLPEDVS
ncbi:hypothetical protein [Streptomyces diastatochromogenes]|uniref:hypothetical protein n=1 Tax=Streptomyces diastatochromogenes TaxID=42236 RepID=UPI002F26AE47